MTHPPVARPGQYGRLHAQPIFKVWAEVLLRPNADATKQVSSACLLLRMLFRCWLVYVQTHY